MGVALFLIFLLLLGVFIVLYKTRTAAINLIQTFYKKNAFSPDKALTMQELGIKQRGMMDQLVHMPDYRPGALQVLVQNGIVVPLEQYQYFYLSEENYKSFHTTAVNESWLDKINRFMIPSYFK